MGFDWRLRVVAALAAGMMFAPTLQGACFALPAFQPPVSGPLTKKFEAPSTPYSSGHRGIDFAVGVGTPVRASADGVVTFSGPVGGAGLFVSIDHGAGLVTTYSFLSATEVSKGARVKRGQLVGSSGLGHPDDPTPALHFGAKLEGRYIDPAALLLSDLEDISDFLALAPIAPSDPAGETPAGLDGPAAGSSVQQVSKPGDGLVAKGMRWIKGRLSTIAGAFELAASYAKGAVEQLACSNSGGVTPPDIPSTQAFHKGEAAPSPPNSNIVVAVAGIGSATSVTAGGDISSNASMYNSDLASLGFDEASIFHFSYRGTAFKTRDDRYRFHEPYAKQDTFLSIRYSAFLLAQQIERIHKLHPNKTIDLVAHSQGGLVAQYYLSWFYRPDLPGGPRIGSFISIATPHHGADAAQFHRRLTTSEGGLLLLDGWDTIAASTGLPKPDSPSVLEMDESSVFIRQLNENWRPEKVPTTAIAATFDLVVTPQHSRLPSANNYTADLPMAPSSLFLAHSAVVEAPDTKAILYNALAGRPSACTSLRNAVADHTVGRVISGIADLLLEGYGAVAALPLLPYPP